MATRGSLELRAASAGVVIASYPNDSKLEQAVIYAEQHRTASTTSTTYAPSPLALKQHGGANV